MTKFDLRPYTPADAGVVVQLINAAAAQTLGVQRAVLDAVGTVRLSRYVPNSSAKVVATTPTGEVVGYAYVADQERAIVFELGGAVHPHYWGQGVGQQLVAWAEQHAKTLAERAAPAGVKAVLQVNLYPAETEALRLFAHAGFAPVREWLHLVVALTAPPPAPTLPAGLVLRPMDLENDWDLVSPAMDAAFADHWGTLTLPPEDAPAPEDETETSTAAEPPPTDDSYSNAPGFCFVALDGETAVGGILCNAKLVERADTGRVGSMFVHPRYRRQGVGRALMLAAFQAFWQHGCRRIINDTDAASFTAAPQFYASLGMTPYRRELLYEKEIRPGREVRRLSVA